MENGFTQAILDKHGSLRIERRTPNGIVFYTGARERLAVLGNHKVHHRLNGEIVPIQANWLTGTNGEYGAAGLSPRVLPDGELQFIGNPFRHKTVGVGLIDLNPFTINVAAQFPTGYVNGNQYIREVGVFSHILTLHENNKVIEDLVIQEKPSSLAGDYFVIASRIYDAAFPPSMQIQPGLVYGDTLVFQNGTAIDANGDHIAVTQYVREGGGSKWLLSGVPTSWLDTAAYPVTIDPTYSVQPDATAGIDAHADSSQSTTNLGTSENLWTMRVNNTWNGVAYIKFDLSSIDDFAAIIDATVGLNLNFSENITFPHQVFMRASRRAWTESGVCWSYWTGTSGWGTAPGRNITTDVYNVIEDTVTYSSTPTYQFYYWDVTNASEDWLTGVYANNGLIIDYDTGGSNYCAKRYTSSDSGTAGNRPTYELNYVARTLGGVPLFFS